MYRNSCTTRPYHIPELLKTKIPEAPKRGLHRENCESDKLLLNLVQWHMEPQKHSAFGKHQHGKPEIVPSPQELDDRLDRFSDLMDQQHRITKLQSSRSKLKRAICNHKNRFRSASRKASDTEIETLRKEFSDILAALKTHEESRTAFTNKIIGNIDKINKAPTQPESTNKHGKSEKPSSSRSRKTSGSQQKDLNGKNKVSQPNPRLWAKIHVVEESESSGSPSPSATGRKPPLKITIKASDSSDSSEFSTSNEMAVELNNRAPSSKKTRR
ncbi:MAG: hypothetical protein EOO27_14325 [Comamonadaceae bacterium]|nr:MAG: hypothetical protein EOO27_14325 [Comamonadaceae bacterium]